LNALFLLAVLVAADPSPVPADLAAAIQTVETDRALLAVDLAKLQAVFSAHYPPVIPPLPTPAPAVHAVGLVMIGGQGCAPCIKMRPILAQLKTEGITVTEIEAGSAEGLKYQVAATPTFITLCDGVELHRSVGSLTHDQVATWWSDTLAWVKRKYP
jgi:thiol-disulfide isomerase/thioredoxin